MVHKEQIGPTLDVPLDNSQVVERSNKMSALITHQNQSESGEVVTKNHPEDGFDGFGCDCGRKTGRSGFLFLSVRSFLGFQLFLICRIFSAKSENRWRQNSWGSNQVDCLSAAGRGQRGRLLYWISNQFSVYPICCPLCMLG